jgi:P-type Cu2+ transporter
MAHEEATVATTLTVPQGSEAEPQYSAPEAAAPPSNVILTVENMHCGGCMRTVEAALAGVPGVHGARVNLSERRVVAAADPETCVDSMIAALKSAGFQAFQLNPNVDLENDTRSQDLTRRLGVAAFATMNVMLLSVSVWSGAEGDMSPAVRSLFHWLSALIALPAIAYSGQPFFNSAWQAVSARRVNMDVPISIGVILTASLSLYQTIEGNDRIYFDAAIMLLTFLLLGRLLDQLMRRRAASAAANLLKLRQITVKVLDGDGSQRRHPVQDVCPGTKILVASGERFALDGRVVEGQSTIDQSAITGETLPHPVSSGSEVFSGSINLGQPLVMEATAPEDKSLLCEIVSLLETAEQQRGKYVVVADRAARLYAPMVHTLAALTFIGWMFYGADWQTALPIAVAVLIITCPCALALAVPAVQVAAAGRLMKQGIILKTPDGLERLADCDTIVFDKTGTLTMGEPHLANGDEIDDAELSLAANLAANSTHPFSKAIVQAATLRGLTVIPMSECTETPGYGLAARHDNVELRIGSATWCGLNKPEKKSASVYFRNADGDVRPLEFDDQVKADAVEVIKALQKRGFQIEMLSGDHPDGVAKIAESLAIDRWTAAQKPAEKVERLKALSEQGRNVLMVGDGLNDAPSLAAAHASMSPANASHISQTAADVVFQGQALEPILSALSVSKTANRLVTQNFALALGYNILFVPLAIVGLVTPLIAAIAMSVSSISVTANALRISLRPAGRAA